METNLFTVMLLNAVSILIFCSVFVSINATPSSREGDEKCGYEACPAIKPDMLNVHIVAHTHDDVGWLKTVDQYYFGSKNTIQKAGVQYILDNVVRALLRNPDRRFIYVESAFFTKWWNEQTDSKKEEVKMLVREGRLSFAGGAWSMNDEAITHYQSIVDQFTWGLRFLNDTFGECGRPTIGWQIDPFGHSNAQATLFSEMGYDGVFFSRLDYQDKIKRMNESRMETVWKSSRSLDDADILAGALYMQWYNAPNGFCFDYLWCVDDPIIDDKRSVEYNVDRRISEFESVMRDYEKVYRSNNVMLTMGGDFTFQIAEAYFKNLDKLIKHTNERQSQLKINAFYSTPACYLKSLHDSNIEWPIKTDDYFPYASDPHSYWAGYYTSRATLKGFERMGNHFLQICKQLTAASEAEESFFEENLNSLRGIMGVMQHHDAVTGTEKQHVTDAYSRELHASISKCEMNTKSSLNQFITNTSDTTEWKFNFSSCLQLNISTCDVTESSTRFVVTVYNPLSHTTSQYVRFPVANYNYEIRDSSNNLVASQFLPIPTPLANLHYRNSEATNEVAFYATDIPPVGYKSFFVTRLTAADPVNIETPPTGAATVGGDDFQISFTNGLLSGITIDGDTSELSQNFFYYTGATMNNNIFANRSSGAYIFRPAPNTSDTLIGTNVQISVIRGNLVDEVHQIFNDWVSQVIRIYKTLRHIEFEWLVGPIATEDNIAKEIVSKFTTNINSESVFYTDSNGRDMMRRKRGERETWDVEMFEQISGNYYPVTTRIAIEDENYRLAVLTDRAEGGSSLDDGTIELMVHRRLLRDDTFGVDEALNETAYGQGLIVRGKHWLHFGRKTSQSPTLEARERIHQNQVLLPVWPFFDDATTISFNDWSSQYTNTFSAIGADLPANIFLMAFEPWKDNSFLIRFEHIMETDEDPQLSMPVSFNVSHIFPGSFTLSEVSLGANQWIENMSRLRFKHEGSVRPTEGKSNRKPTERQTDGSQFVVTMNPMEIRTFIMTPIVDSGSGTKSRIAVGFVVLISVLVNFIRK
ncbi:lysosomal alpha-mannosidase-like [Bradysia coprophila]|uniref:lysosomal alpha-mannosidase-like n=1 Tax=Bradysia coprophila TaxID=38358 RepID=UPI00187D7DAE|nr:lysosomal alpha-mannosidase-like [Bradysia coprophila]